MNSHYWLMGLCLGGWIASVILNFQLIRVNQSAIRLNEKLLRENEALIGDLKAIAESYRLYAKP